MEAADAAVMFQVESRTQPGHSYTVTAQDGHLSCDCPSHVECWHRRKVRSDHPEVIAEQIAGVALESIRKSLVGTDPMNDPVRFTRFVEDVVEKWSGVDIPAERLTWQLSASVRGEAGARAAAVFAPPTGGSK